MIAVFSRCVRGVCRRNVYFGFWALPKNVLNRSFALDIVYTHFKELNTPTIKRSSIQNDLWQRRFYETLRSNIFLLSNAN